MKTYTTRSRGLFGRLPLQEPDTIWTGGAFASRPVRRAGSPGGHPLMVLAPVSRLHRRRNGFRVTTGRQRERSAGRRHALGSYAPCLQALKGRPRDREVLGRSATDGRRRLGLARRVGTQPAASGGVDQRGGRVKPPQRRRRRRRRRRIALR